MDFVIKEEELDLGLYDGHNQSLDPAATVQDGGGDDLPSSAAAAVNDANMAETGEIPEGNLLGLALRGEQEQFDESHIVPANSLTPTEASEISSDDDGGEWCDASTDEDDNNVDSVSPEGDKTYNVGNIPKYWNPKVMLEKVERKQEVAAEGGGGSFPCKYCKKSLSNRSNLNKHIKMVHNTKKKRKCCRLCGLRFVHQNALNSHMRVHLRSKEDFNCRVCKKGFSTKGNLATHLKTHTDMAEFKCLTCDDLFPDGETLNEHMVTHEVVSSSSKGARVKRDGGKINCQHCTKSFSTKTLLDSHMKSHVCCKECGLEFSNKNALSTHIRTVSCGKHCCELCGRGFGHESNLIMHMKTHSSSSFMAEAKSDEEVIVASTCSCKSCGAEFDDKISLSVHLMSCQGVKKSNTSENVVEADEKPHLCKICSMRFRYVQSLASHMNRKHSPDELKELESKKKSNELVVVKGKSLVCEICAKAFKKRQYLRVHIKKFHANTGYKLKALRRRNFSAKVPGRILNQSKRKNKGQIVANPYSRRVTRKKSVSSVAGDKVCRVCGEYFPDSRSLKTHMTMHGTTGDKRHFVCEICGEGFYHKFSLEKHEIQHLNDDVPLIDVEEEISVDAVQSLEPLSCEYCGKEFSNPDNLTRHVNLHTRGEGKISKKLAKTNSVAKGEDKRESKEVRCYSCKLCDLKFVGMTLHSLHMKTHLKCTLCNLQCKSISSFSEHAKTHPAYLPFSCQKCDKRFILFDSFCKHLGYHSKVKGEKEFVCETCGKAYGSKKYYRLHMQSHEFEGVKGPVIFPALDDDQVPINMTGSSHEGQFEPLADVVDMKNELKYFPDESDPSDGHFLTQAPRKRNCGRCDLSFATIPELKAHLKSHLKCGACGLQCKSEHVLRKHVRKHPEYRPFRCKFCPKGFRDYHTFIKHEGLHKRVEPSTKAYICKFCGRGYDNMASVARHCSVIHGTTSRAIKNLQLPQNSSEGANFVAQKVETPIKTDLADLSSKSVDGGYVCKFCNKRFQHRNHFLSHSQLHMKVEPNPNDPFPCTICGRGFKCDWALSRHIKVHAGENENDSELNRELAKPATDKYVPPLRIKKPFGCLYCSKSFFTSSLLTSHLKTHYQCNECGLQCSGKSDLENHEETHKSEPCICLFCKRPLTDIIELAKHMRNIHRIPDPTPFLSQQPAAPSPVEREEKPYVEEKAYVCRICEKCFSTERSLKSHCKVHDREDSDGVDMAKDTLPEPSASKMYSCEHCGRNYSDRNSYHSHVQAHSIDFVCNECDEMFTTGALLKKHMGTHGKILNDEESNLPRNDPKLVCSECGEIFNTELLFKSHMKTHDQQKPHVCNTCGQRFLANSSLTIHMLIHNQVELDSSDSSDMERLDDAPPVNIVVDVDVKPLACVPCDMYFQFDDGYEEHLKTHNTTFSSGDVDVVPDSEVSEVPGSSNTERITFSCLFCPESFDTKDLLLTHVQTHNPGDRTHVLKVCPVCKKEFNGGIALSNHLRAHGKIVDDQACNDSERNAGLEDESEMVVDNESSINACNDMGVAILEETDHATNTTVFKKFSPSEEASGVSAIVRDDASVTKEPSHLKNSREVPVDVSEELNETKNLFPEESFGAYDEPKDELDKMKATCNLPQENSVVESDESNNGTDEVIGALSQEGPVEAVEISEVCNVKEQDVVSDPVIASKVFNEYNTMSRTEPTMTSIDSKNQPDELNEDNNLSNEKLFEASDGMEEGSSLSQEDAVMAFNDINEDDIISQNEPTKASDDSKNQPDERNIANLSNEKPSEESDGMEEANNLSQGEPVVAFNDINEDDGISQDESTDDSKNQPDELNKANNLSNEKPFEASDGMEEASNLSQKEPVETSDRFKDQKDERNVPDNGAKKEPATASNDNNEADTVSQAELVKTSNKMEEIDSVSLNEPIKACDESKTRSNKLNEVDTLESRSLDGLLESRKPMEEIEETNLAADEFVESILHTNDLNNDSQQNTSLEEPTADSDIKIIVPDKTLNSSGSSLLSTGGSPKPFGCPECGRRFKCESNLKIHLLTFTHSTKVNPLAIDIKVEPDLYQNSHTESSRVGYSVRLLGGNNGPKRKLDVPNYVTSRKILYKCEQCDSSFHFKRNLNHHLRLHNSVLSGIKSEDGAATCPQCKKGFATKEEMMTHSRSHNGKQCYRCKYCNERFVTKMVRREHAFLVHSDKKWKPSYFHEDVMDVETDSNQELTHLDSKPSDFQKEAIGVEIASNQEFICPICGLCCNGVPRLRNHLQSHADDAVLYPDPCGNCGRRFKSQQGLVRHMLVEESCHIIVNSKPRGLQDDVEDVMEGAHMDVPDNVKEGLGDIKENCVMDPMMDSNNFSYAYNISMLKKNPKKPFSCVLCTASYGNESTLELHLTLHAKDVAMRPHVCPGCGRRFKLPHHLDNHLKYQTLYCIPEQRQEVEEMYKYVSTLKVESVVTVKVEKHDSEYDVDDKVLYECNLCGKAFGGESFLKGHITRIHTPKTDIPPSRKELLRFKCLMCSALFMEEESLNAHVLKHVKDLDKPYACGRCHKRFVNATRLNVHERICDRAEDECQKIKEIYESLTDLNESKKQLGHTVGNNEEDGPVEKPYQCSQCEETFTFRSARRNHVSLAHPEVNPDEVVEVEQENANKAENWYECPFCGQVFDTRRGRTWHISKVHSNKQTVYISRQERRRRKKPKPPLECRICIRRFTFPFDLEDHLANAHANDDVERPYACVKCERRFKMKRNLDEHMQMHEGGEDTRRFKSRIRYTPFNCRVCAKRFVFEKQLERHMLTHSNDHDKRPYSCNLCERRFMKRLPLEHHLEMHKSGGRVGRYKRRYVLPFICRICIKSFAEEIDLEKHLLTHANDAIERPYVCSCSSNCERRFKTDKALKLHMIAFTRESRDPKNPIIPHACRVCMKSFKLEVDLTEHVLTHEHDGAERPHACGLCERRFVMRESLDLHLHTNHGYVHFGHFEESGVNLPIPTDEMLRDANTIEYGHFIAHSSDFTRPNTSEQYLAASSSSGGIVSANPTVALVNDGAGTSEQSTAGNEKHGTASMDMDTSERSDKHTMNMDTLIGATNDKEVTTSIIPSCSNICEKINNEDKPMDDILAPNLSSKNVHSAKTMNDGLEVYDEDSNFSNETLYLTDYENNVDEATNDDSQMPVLDLCVNDKYDLNQGIVSLDNSQAAPDLSAQNNVPNDSKKTNETLELNSSGSNQIDSGIKNIDTLTVSSSNERIDIDAVNHQPGYSLIANVMNSQGSSHNQLVSPFYNKTDAAELNSTSGVGNVVKQVSVGVSRPPAEPVSSTGHEQQRQVYDRSAKQSSSSRSVPNLFGANFGVTFGDLLPPSGDTTSEEFGNTSSSTLMGHELLQVPSNTVQTFKCQYSLCAKEFKSMKSLRFHLTKNHSASVGLTTDKKRHGCPNCGKIFAFRSSMLIHMAEHADDPYSCSQCQRTFKTKWRYYAHEKSHTVDSNNTDKAVGSVNQSTDSVEVIVNEKSNEPVVEPLPTEENKLGVSCETCGKTFEAEKSLKIHIGKSHGGLAKIRKTSVQPELLPHIKEELEDFEPYDCPKCPKRFSSENVRDLHLETHDDAAKLVASGQPNTEFPFSCLQCSKRFRYEKSLNHHVLKHARENLSGAEPATSIPLAQTSNFMPVATENSAGNPQKHYCPYCRSCFKYRKHFNFHLAMVHVKSNFEKDSFIKMYSDDAMGEKIDGLSNKCQHCQQVFKLEESLTAHLLELLQDKEKSDAVDEGNNLSDPLAIQVPVTSSFGCSFCSQTFKAKHDLDRHFLSHGPTMKRFRCGTCKKGFTNAAHLKRHVFGAHKNNIFACPYCKDTFKNVQLFYLHIRKHGFEGNSSMLELICPCCNKRFKREKTLSSHLLKHVKGSLGVGTAAKPEVKVAEKKIDVPVSPPVSPLRCRHCRRTYSSKIRLMSHTSSCSSHGRVHKCIECSARFVRKEHLTRHIKSFHGPKALHECPNCDKSFSNLQLYSLHLRSHDEKPVAKGAGKNEENCFPYKCKQCSKGFLFLRNLRTHEASHKGKRGKTPVEDVVQDVGNNSGLAKVKRGIDKIQGGLFPFQCDFCIKGFMLEANLKTHLATHNSGSPSTSEKKVTNRTKKPSYISVKRPSKAEDSDFPKPSTSHAAKKNTVKAASGTVVGKNNILISVLSGPKFCPYCGRQCRDSSSLEVHMRTHTKERPIPCWYCPKTFSCSSSRNLHALKAHGENTKKCQQCSKVFKTAEILRKHLANKHADVDAGEVETAANKTKKKRGKTPKGKKAKKDCELICPYCPKKFNYAKCFDAHLRLHSSGTVDRDDFPFGCPLCSKKFQFEKSFKAHMAKHRKDRRSMGPGATSAAGINSVAIDDDGDSSYMTRRPNDDTECYDVE